VDERCPRTVELSALIDGQLADAERARIDAHLAGCASCGAMLADLGALRAELRQLPDERLGFDLSEVVRGRIAAASGARPAPRTRPGWREWLPIGVGATAALSAGLSMGLALTAGSGAALAPRIAAMAVFDPVAPGGLCIGLDACYAPRGTAGGQPR
jgi:anti-sigma factor RsiW